MLDVQKPLPNSDLLTVDHLLEYFSIKDKRTLWSNLTLLDIRARTIGKQIYVRRSELEKKINEYFEK